MHNVNVCGGSMTMHWNQGDFAAIAITICLLTITRCFGTDGKVVIRDAEYAIWLTRGCFINWKNTIRIHQTTNVSIVCKHLRNDCISIIVTTQTNLGPGLVKVVTWFAVGHGANGISQIKLKCHQRLQSYQPKSKHIPVSKANIPLHQSVRFVPSRMVLAVRARASSCSN